jgi:hypothetical protein
MDANYTQNQDQPLLWNKYDDSDIDALLSETQLVKFYQEVGGRRVIQKIITHLKNHNCNGMAVQSTGEDIWKLSIRKKDIKIANEIADSKIE